MARKITLRRCEKGFYTDQLERWIIFSVYYAGGLPWTHHSPKWCLAIAIPHPDRIEIGKELGWYRTMKDALTDLQTAKTPGNKNQRQCFWGTHWSHKMADAGIPVATIRQMR